MAAVQVPRALLAVLALGTLLAAFLMGRQCSRTDTHPSAAAPAPTTTVAAPPLEAPPVTTTLAEAAAAPAEPPPTLVPSTLLPAAEPAPSSVEPASADVERYFQEADVIQAKAKYWSDPQALAKSILDQASSGNTAAFDELIRAQQAARTELERLHAPPACAEHHRRSLAAMGDALALLERLKGALASGDLEGLDALPQAARDLEREARAIDELGKTIRRR